MKKTTKPVRLPLTTETLRPLADANGIAGGKPTTTTLICLVSKVQTC